METDVPILTYIRDQLSGATLSLISFACLAFVFQSVRGGTTAMVGPVLLHGQPALFIIAGLLSGPVAVLGALAGHAVAVADLLSAALVTLCGYAYLGLTAYVLRDHLWQQTTTTDDRLYRRLGGLAVVAVGPALGAAALMGWGYELLGQFHFFPYAPLTVLSLIASTVLYRGPVLILLSLRTPERLWSLSDHLGRTPPDSRRESVGIRVTHLSALPLA
jgi:hypothetical protein